MLVTVNSVRPRRGPLGVSIEEAAAAIDTVNAGQAFALLLDEPALAADALNGFIGEPVFEAASATDTLDAQGMWTPAQIPPLAWYDASDSNNVTLTGSDVDQWDDLSGNGNHVTQATAGNKPDYTTAGSNQIDGKNTITFDGTDDYLVKATLAGFPANNTSAISSVCVFRTRNVANRGYWDITDATQTNRTALLLSTSTAMVARAGAAANEAQIAFTDTTNAHLWSSVHQTTERSLRQNGGTANTNTVGTGTMTYTNFRIGRLFQDVFPMLGDFAELILFSGKDATTREKCEGYLAHKWGLEGNLPAGHPYKSAPP